MEWQYDIAEKLGLRYSIRDPIHGFIHFNELEKSIIDHPWFQRLRRIRQLAFTEYIYPGATHTRFEHSLGVMHLATRIFLRIISKCEKNELMELLEYETPDEYKADVLKTTKLLRLSALMHDIGHGPFSHAVETAFPRIEKDPLKRRHSHESYSRAAIEAMSDYLHEIQQKLTGCESALDPVTAGEVIRLLTEERDVHKISGRLEPLARSILSGSVDADRLDYLLRDSHHVGVTYGLYDLERVVEAATFCMQSPGKADEEFSGEEESTAFSPILAFEEDDCDTAESVVLARARMFSSVYMHKTRRLFDLLFAYALPSLIGGTFTSPLNVQEYLLWDDWRVLGELREAEAAPVLLLKRALCERRFPRWAGECKPDDQTRRVTSALRSEGFAVVTDKELAKAPPEEIPDVWIDTGAEFTAYKAGSAKEVKLRYRKAGETENDPYYTRYAPIPLSERLERIKVYDPLQDRRNRIYCTEDKRKEVSRVVRGCGGAPWEG